MKYVTTLAFILMCSFTYAQTDSLKVIDIPLGEVTKKDIHKELEALRSAQENLAKILTYIQETHGLDSLQFVGFLPDLKGVRFQEKENKLTK